MTVQASEPQEAGWDTLGGASISDPQAAEAAGRLIPSTAEQVQRLLTLQPGALNHTLDIVRKRLDAGISGDTYGNLFAGLANYLGADAGTLLAWLAQAQADPAEQQARLNALEERTRATFPEVAAFYRAIIGSYGSEIEQALTRSNELPNNWNVLSREVVYDVLEEKYRIRVTVEKFNGEKVVIEGPPDSILSLATGLIVTARLVDSRDAFSEDRIAAFLEKADDMIGLLRPQTETEALDAGGQDKTG